MSVYQLSAEYLAFPNPAEANPDGLLAVGGSLEPDWLLLAYQSGIFPWFNNGDPILWWSPESRSVLRLDELHISKSMRPYLNSTSYTFKLDTEFEKVLDHCAQIPRTNAQGTWITDEMKRAYFKLHSLGVAHSAEIWLGDKLVGGLYGVSIGRIFFGESMFSLKPNMSKLALIRLSSWLKDREFTLIDCQIHNPHLASLGATEISRRAFLRELELSLEKETIPGPWFIS